MKNITLNWLIISFLFMMNWPLSAQCPQLVKYDYNILKINSNWETCRKNFLTKDITVKFPTNEVIEEFTGKVATLQVNFNTGNGFEFVDDDLTVENSYGSIGDKIISVQACFDDQSTGCFFFKTYHLTIRSTSHDYYSPDLIIDLEAPDGITWAPSCNAYLDNSNGYQGSTIGKGKAYVKYAPGNNKITKPVIFVDGLDLGTDKKRVSDYTFSGGGIIRYGSTGWDVIVTGTSETFSSPDPLYPTSEFDLYPMAFDELYDKGYDLVFVDFERGADYIQKNGIVLMDAIHKINELKVSDASGIRHENIVVGASMGGQIARWTLATMENQGDCSETSTYLSFDSPHKGANVSLGLQAAAWYSAKEEIDDDLWIDLNKPAPRQLLIENFGNAMQDGKLTAESWTGGGAYSIESNFDYGCLRTAYVKEMEELGYPKTTRNIAISCGSETGIDQGYDADAQLFKSKFIPDWYYEPVHRGGIWALNGGSSGGDPHYVKYGKEVVCGPTGTYALPQAYDDLLLVLASADQNSLVGCLGNEIPGEDSYSSIVVRNSFDYPHYDNSPGCYRTDLFKIQKLVDDQLAGLDGVKTNDILQDRFQQTFMPTMSTLDINWNMNNTNMWKDIDNEEIITNGLTPFEAYYAPPNNLKHVQMDQGMIDWVIVQLDYAENQSVGELPTNGNTTYNYGISGQNFIRGVQINNGGILRVNDDGPTKYLDGPATTQSTFTAYINGCNANIDIESGGRFILGNDGSGISRKAIVYVEANNTVHVKTGGKLRLARGSQLVIKKGAKLIIDDGADIDLWWGESSIVVQGELEINGDFEFLGSGFFQFDHTHTLTLNADFNLGGQGIANRFMRLSKGTILEVDNAGINLSNGLIEVAPSASMHILSNGHITTEFVKFQSTTQGFDAGNGLKLFNVESADLDKTIFEDFFVGLTIIDPPSPDQLRIDICRFYNNEFGIAVSNGDEVIIESSIFLAEEKGGIGISAVDLNELTITGCTLENYTLYDNYGGAAQLNNIEVVNSNSNRFRDNKRSVVIEDVNEYYMNGGFIDKTFGDIDQSSIGIYAPTHNNQSNISNISLRSGAKIADQGYGIKVDAGGILDGSNAVFGRVLMDCGKLVNNIKGIEGKDITLKINAFEFCGCTSIEDAIPNTFIKSSVSSLYFDICYEQITPPNNGILAQGNYWNENPIPVEDYLLIDCINNVNYPLIKDMQMTQEPNACVPGGIGKEGPWDPKVSIARSSDGSSSDDKLNSKSSAISVYPNPFTDRIYVETTVAESGTLSIQVLDLLGKVVQSEEITVVQGENILSITTDRNLVAGVYYLRTQMKGQEAEMFKVIHIADY